MGKHVVARSVATMEGHGSSSPLMYVALLPFYFVTVFASFFPWSLKLPSLLRQLRQRCDVTDKFLLIGVAIIFGIFTLGPALLAGFLFLGMWQIPPLHWRWLFWIPAGIATIAAVAMAIFVKDAPEQAGYPTINPEEQTGGDVRAQFFETTRR